ncbi:MAG: hypothetical protein IJ037_03320, partial [Clostridia bacterium]|nr:hypothetical protein [Clostridia bacterium]
MKRTISTILLIAMLASMTACGEQAATETTPDDTTPAAVETEVQESETEKLLPDIPDTTYDGQELRFL